MTRKVEKPKHHITKDLIINDKKKWRNLNII